MARIKYVELPAEALEPTKLFYEAAFDWSLARFGPSYAATTTGDVDLGLQGDISEAPAAPLPVIEVTDLDSWPARIKAAGGRIAKPIFAFPGGRRFHFTDPAGNELAIVEPAH